MIHQPDIQEEKSQLAPMMTLLNGMTLSSWFIGISLIILSILISTWPVAVAGILIPALTALFRRPVEQWILKGELQKSATALAAGYLFALFVTLLLIGDPLIVPLILIQSLLPILLSIVYDLSWAPQFVGASIILYVGLLISLLTPLPTGLPINETSHIVLLINVLFLGVSRLIQTYFVVQRIFVQQQKENRNSLSMLEILQADLKLRNAQLEQVAQASEQANLAKTQFLQHMSHELRSPLNTVIGISEIIAEDLDAFPPDMIKEQARQIYKAGQHLLSVISDVLDIAKIESGTFQVYYEPVDPLVVIKDLDAVIAGLKARWPDIIFEAQIPETLPMILAEDRRIRQILINLIDNAFKYTRKGEVTLRVWEDEEGIWFSVKDSGIGITPENYKRIFEPFEQVDGKQAVGTGLGLAITRHLVMEHGGTLSVESKPGFGSTFSVFLPKTEVVFPVKGSGTVLLVDDDKNIHAVLKHQLSRAGYETIAVAAPDEAREALKTQSVAAVILDIYLPAEEIGWQFLRELTSAPDSVPVVVYSVIRDKEQIAKLGATYVEKPARPSALIRAINVVAKPSAVMV